MILNIVTPKVEIFSPQPLHIDAQENQICRERLHLSTAQNWWNIYNHWYWNAQFSDIYPIRYSPVLNIYNTSYKIPVYTLGTLINVYQHFFISLVLFNFFSCLVSTLQ